VTVTYSLNASADQTYTVTPTVTGGALVGVASKTITAGRRSVSFEIVRTTEGAVSCDFAVSPSLTRVASPLACYFTHAPQIVGFTEEPLNLARMVWVEDWLVGGGVYMRFQLLTQWSAATVTVRAERSDISGAVTPVNYRPAKEYSLLIDDVPVATVNAAEGDKWLVFSVPTAGISTGWHRLRIGGLSDGETSPTHFVFMRRPGFTNPKLIPISTSTYAIEQRPGPAVHAYGYMPMAYAPRPAPLPPRNWIPFSNQETLAMVAVPLTAFDRYTPHTPNISATGVVSSFNAQAYHWYDFIAKWPRVNLLDGPRGVGAISMVAHINLAAATVRADGSGGVVRHIYALDPWRMCRVSDSGEIKTLAGYRHRPMASYYGDSPGFPSTEPTNQTTLELVGDWSAIPVERRGFHELWGMVWLPSSVVVDTSLPLIDDEGVLREQHPVGPSALLTDTQNNRIARVTFHPTDRDRPATVTEWLTGLGDPWGITTWENPATGQYEIIISERSNHRIVAYSEDGVFLRTIVQRDPGLPGNATLSSLRTMTPTGTLEEARAQPCLGPEDVHVMDNWLYWGSYAQRQLRRIDLVTGVQEVFADLSESDLNGAIGGGYVKFSLSDGTFGPRHTAFVATWSVVSPAVIGGFLEGGGRWRFASAFGAFETAGYGAAVAVGQGRMLIGMSEYGITEVYKGPKADAVLYTTGRSEWRTMFGHVKYGPYGFGTFGQALPWGQSASIDYFLEQLGHQRPET